MIMKDYDIRRTLAKGLCDDVTAAYYDSVLTTLEEHIEGYHHIRLIHESHP